MASRALKMGGAPAPLDLMLASIPSLPRALLSRLVARMIDRLDEIDGDADLEPDNDNETAWLERIDQRDLFGRPADGGLRWNMSVASEDEEDDDPRENAEAEDVGGAGFHCIDQRRGVYAIGSRHVRIIDL